MIYGGGADTIEIGKIIEAQRRMKETGAGDAKKSGAIKKRPKCSNADKMQREKPEQPCKRQPDSKDAAESKETAGSKRQPESKETA